MRELLTVVTRKGQITLPAEIRRSLGIEEGDKIAVSIADPQNARIMLRPIRSVAEMTFGAVHPRQRPEDIKELRDLFQESMAERHRPSAADAAEEET